jgi:hypothetical protein
LYVLQSPAVSRLVVAVVWLGLLGLVGPGCGPLVQHPPYVAQPAAALIRVDSPPPPARVELIPARPSPGAVWIDGEWIWRREQWAWLPGRWLSIPAGCSFSPWVFVRGADGRLFYAPGAWRDAKGTLVDPPDALATAAVETGVVVTADGDTEVTGPSIRRRPRPAASVAPPDTSASPPAK